MKKRYARILAATLSAAMVFTSAPTAAFATELSVSEDAVEAEGAAANKQTIDAEFPTAAYITYSDSAKATIVASDLVDADGTEVGTTYTKVVPTLVGLKNLKVGDKVNVDFVLDVSDDSVDGNGDKDYSGISGYNKNTVTVTRTVPVTCIADTFAGVYVTDTVHTVYGTGVAKIYSDYGTKVESEDWTVTYLDPSVAKADASNTPIEKAAKVTSVATYDGTKVDVAKWVKTQNDSAKYEKWSFANGHLTCVVPVTVEKAEVDAAVVDWPTGFTTKVTVGTDVSKLEFNKTSKYGKFTIKNATLDTSSAGEDEYTIVLTAGDNYEFVDFAYVKGLDNGNCTASKLEKTVKQNVEKKALEENEYKPVLAKTEYKYGDTYQTVIDSITEVTGVSYTVKGVAVGNLGDHKLKVGTNNLIVRATVDNADDYTLADGSDFKDYSFSVTVKKAEVKVNLSKASFGQKKGSGVEVTASKDGDGYPAEFAGDDALTEEFEWFTANGTSVKKTAAYTPDDSKVGVESYYCKMKLVFETPDLATDDAKALFTALYGDGVFTSDTIKVTTSLTVFGAAEGFTSDAKTITYGDPSFNTDITYTKDVAYTTNPEVNAYIVDENGNKKAISAVTAADLSKVTASIPTGLNAGKYQVVVELTVTNDSDPDKKDTAVKVLALTVNKATIDEAALDNGGNVYVVAPTKNYVYGTKTADIVVTAKKKSVAKLGTFSVAKSNDEYLAATTATVKLTFTLNEDAAKNYELDADTNNMYQTFPVDAAVLKVTPKTVTIKVGEELPKLNNNDIEFTGIVAGDDVKDAAITAELKYAPGVENKIATVGKVEEAIRLTAKTGGANITSGTTTVLNGKYKVELVYGTVEVVSATAPTTPPTVAPTPAPVKQATAAAPKAAKAKATVKVGKKYTLKLKYAAGKKATVKKVKWTSSKKSVATVSSKGKVTAKKAGKATIYARVYFKDGSMKKIKFTVTVK